MLETGAKVLRKERNRGRDRFAAGSTVFGHTDSRMEHLAQNGSLAVTEREPLRFALKEKARDCDAGRAGLSPRMEIKVL